MKTTKTLAESKANFRFAFNSIRNKDEISHRTSNTGIGKTFEDIVGVKENNYSKKDWEGNIEIKSTRNTTKSKITLFCYSPSGEATATKFRNNYGKSDLEFPSFKTLHTTISAKQKNSYNKTFSFKLVLDDFNQEVKIDVFKYKSNEILEDNIFIMTYNEILEAFKEKCNCIALVYADVTKTNTGEEIFNFKEGKFLEGATKESFFEQIKQGNIVYEFRHGIYRSGNKKGQLHDHGSCFRIKKNIIDKLFSKQEII